MNKTCARCEKTVYPIEELKCLDKIWHKGCFKCQECGMTLNMKTYKGYGKLPYCEAHVPKVKPTTMAETPELRRIAENTKIQSNVTYHAAFEKSKGKFTQVADDPEILRIRANTKIISNVAYHGDLAKKAAMEKQRTLNENGEVVELPAMDNYHIQLENYASEMLPAPPPVDHSSNRAVQQPTNQHHSYHQPANHAHDDYGHANYTNAYSEDNGLNNYGKSANVNYAPNVQISSYAKAQPNSVYDDYDDSYNHRQYQPQYQPPANPPSQQSQQRIGRIADYDPISDGPRNTPYTQRQSATLIYSSAENNGRAVAHQAQSLPQNRRIGSVADIDPLNEVYGSLANTHISQQHHNNQVYQSHQHQPQQQTRHSQQQVPVQQKSGKATSGSKVSPRIFIAMYDYEATDSDEVSFREGDLITNVSSIDSGWMTGRIQRTGESGMLPANYVELARI